MIRKNLFITGRPGVGKTTVVRHVLHELPPSIACEGFVTGEIRSSGVRSGFEICTVKGQRGVLAHRDFKTPQRVGKYGVDIARFENMVLPLFSQTGVNVFVIDEIGKMECFSRSFCRCMRRLLDSGPPVFGSITLRGEGFIREVKSRKDIEFIEITPSNRTTIVPVLVAKILERFDHQFG